MRFCLWCFLLALALVTALFPVGVHSEAPTAAAVQNIQPKRVTIQDKEISFRQALQSFAAQTGVAVTAPPGEDPKLKLNLVQVPFWKALDDIAKEADMRVYPYLTEGKLGLVNGYREMPISYSGPFRVALKRVLMVRDLETDAHFGAASIEVAWLPPFQAFLLETQPSGFVVKDDKGLRLPLPRIGKGHATIFGRNAIILDNVPLPAVRRGVPSLGLIQGKLSMIGAARMLTFTFDNWEKGKEQKQAGVTVKLSEVDTKDPELWQVQFHLYYPKEGPQFESFQMQSWLAGNQLFLVNGKQRVRIKSFNTDTAPADQALITYVINDGEDPQLNLEKIKKSKPGDWKLEYQTPSPVLEVAIPFEFKDVPLP